MSESGSQSVLAGALNALGSPLCVLDAAGTIVAVNQAWRDFAVENGGDSNHFIGQNYISQCDAVSPEARGPSVVARGIRAVLGGEIAHFCYDYACHSPTLQRWFSARIYRIDGQRPYAVVVHVDITDLQRNLIHQEVEQKKLYRLQKLYSAITEFGHITNVSTDLAFLFEEVCRIAVEHGGLRMAWVGQTDASGERLLPVVSFGSGTHYLDGLNISTSADVAEGRGPSGTAYRENRTAINQADHSEFDMSPWRERFEALRWQSSATFPVRNSGRVIAVLTVYSTEVNAFDVAEVDLLERLAANLGQAAESIENRKRQLELEQQLRRSEETYRTLFETVHQGVVFQDTAGAILSANPAAERILGLSLAQLQGLTSADPRWGAIRLDGTPFPGNEHPAMQALNTGQPVIDVTMGVVHPGKKETVWVRINATPVRNRSTGALEYVYAIFDDVSESMRLQRELQIQANRDFLTEAANRRHFFTVGQYELARADRYANETSLLMLDIDHFKVVNDTHGHAAGDLVLKTVAQICKDSLREVDTLGRIGGEEFAILLPQTSQGKACEVAERVRLAVQDMTIPVETSAKAIRVTVSIGVANFNGQTTLDEMLKSADAALYQAKNSGRNRVCPAAG